MQLSLNPNDQADTVQVLAQVEGSGQPRKLCELSEHVVASVDAGQQRSHEHKGGCGSAEEPRRARQGDIGETPAKTHDDRAIKKALMRKRTTVRDKVTQMSESRRPWRAPVENRDTDFTKALSMELRNHKRAKSLKHMVLNCNGIRRMHKGGKFLRAVLKHNPDVIALSEIKIGERIALNVARPRLRVLLLAPNDGRQRTAWCSSAM